jgi:hypothetical protein
MLARQPVTNDEAKQLSDYVTVLPGCSMLSCEAAKLNTAAAVKQYSGSSTSAASSARSQATSAVQ